MDPDRCTVYAKPFPLSTTDEKVKELFAAYGKVVDVKLRRDAASNAFRGSVFIRFDSSASCQEAIARPPLQPGSTSKKLQVVAKSDYERPHKKPSAHTPTSATKSERKPSSLAPSYTAPDALLTSASRKRKTPTDGNRAGPSGSGSGNTSVASLLAQLNERDARVATLEAALEREQQASNGMLTRLTEAQQRAEEAVTTERSIRTKLLAKDAEIGSLKGEVTALRSQMHGRLDAVHTQYKERIHELELLLGRARDEQNASKGKAKLAAATPPPSSLEDPLSDV